MIAIAKTQVIQVQSHSLTASQRGREFRNMNCWCQDEGNWIVSVYMWTQITEGNYYGCLVTALKHCQARIIPNDDMDYKIRAILGKTQFNASLLHWNRAVTSSACFRCGLKEEHKIPCYLCPEALSFYAPPAKNTLRSDRFQLFIHLYVGMYIPMYN